MRFNELRRRVGGISQRMLTLTVRGLERMFCHTHCVSDHSARVDYELTPLGTRCLRQFSILETGLCRT